MGYLRIVVHFIVVLTYLGIGIKLTADAEKFKIDEKAGVWWNSLSTPEAFAPEGQHLRVKARNFYRYGLVIVILYFVIFGR